MKDEDLYEYALSLALKAVEQPMILSNGKYSLHLEIDEDTYWGLIKLGAEIKTDCETYAENILLGHVQAELDRKDAD
jgi:hypothetical protein